MVNSQGEYCSKGVFKPTNVLLASGGCDDKDFRATISSGRNKVVAIANETKQRTQEIRYLWVF